MHEWTWLVLYSDGTELSEDQAGGFGAVDIARVDTLVVLDRNAPELHYAVPIREGMRPIFFRRKRQRVSLGSPSATSGPTIYATALGWQKTVNGRNVKSLIWLMHDGSVAVTDRDLDELEVR